MKVRIHALRTFKLEYFGDLESASTEALVGFLLGVFAYMGYTGKIPMLFFLCGLGAIVCFILSLQTIYSNIKSALKAKNKN